jgi:hypothetical protein
MHPDLAGVAERGAVSAYTSRCERGLAVTCVVAASFAMQGCFYFFGRHYSPSHTQRIVAVGAGSVAAHLAQADGALPIELCRKVCDDNPNGTRTEACYVATIGVVSTFVGPSAPSVGTPFVQCYEYTPGGTDFIIR